MQELKTKIAKAKAELSKQKTMGKTYRDVLLASHAPLPLPSAYPIKTTQTAPSVHALPADLTEILATLAKVLVTAGFVSQ